MTLEHFRSITVKKYDEQTEAIKAAISIAERRLAELNAKEQLSKSESHEKNMIICTIEKGKEILRSRIE